ncbi:MAG: DEAD/DEAH box helicase [Myxococcales bacterium]|nr:DEAD/DEAH box helicase [Myxococcales bacterium]MCB9643395.1 DEAD/DEAH box helicase [Myxococcales bacterium]
MLSNKSLSNQEDNESVNLSDESFSSSEEETSPQKEETSPYQDFSFLPTSIQQSLKEQGIETPTSVQQAAIGPALLGRDVLVQAQTGSGKTLAFGLPIGLLLEKPSDHGQPRALVLAPTRELANQVEAVFSTTLAGLGLRCLPVIGGASYMRQKKALRDGVDIVVGTPGRIADLIQQSALQLGQVRCFVLDEVDQMLDIGFAEELNIVKDALPEEAQVLFFSATIDKRMAQVTKKMLRDPVHLDLSSKDATPANIEHACILVKHEQRQAALINMLLYHAPKQAMVFCATREECRDVANALEARGFNAAPLSGDLSQDAREDTLRRFHDGVLQYLVATNVAARGIDVQALPLVLNYDVPTDVESYTHRIGRTGRAGEDGHAWTLVTPPTIYRYRSHMKALGLAVKYLDLPTQHDILSHSAQRQLAEMLTFADAPVHRSVRRIADQLLATIAPEDAIELVRGLIQKHLASLHAFDSRDLGLTKEELKEEERNRGRSRRRDDDGRGGRFRRDRDRRSFGPRDRREDGGERRQRPRRSDEAGGPPAPARSERSGDAGAQRPRKDKNEGGFSRPRKEKSEDASFSRPRKENKPKSGPKAVRVRSKQTKRTTKRG